MSSISKTVGHRIRMGEFESLTLEVTYVTDVPEGVSMDAFLDHVDRTIADALADDLKQARKHSDRDSYIRDWKG